MIYTITPCFCSSEVLDYGLSRYYATRTEETTHVLLDHHWPINPEKTSKAIIDLAEKYKCKVIRNYKNVGGHGGFNWALEQIPYREEDTIIGYDPDSNPLTPGWDKAALDAFKGDLNLVAVHLMHNHILERGWTIDCDLPRLASLPHPEMYNVTVWRGGFLKLTRGLDATRPFYGGVEYMVGQKMNKMGVRAAYLYDFRETVPEVQHDDRYNKWKAAHAFQGYDKNFSDYLKDGVN